MKLYVVRNGEGKFFRPVGMSGSGKPHWQDSLEKAKFYSKIGPARAVVSNWYKFDPANQYPACDILEFSLNETTAVVIKNDDYVKMARIKTIKRELAMHRRQLVSYRHTYYATGHDKAILDLEKELDSLLQP